MREDRLDVAPDALAGSGRVTVLGLLALTLCAMSGAPARAQFYSLEGRYQCLNDPQAICYDATPSEAPKRPPAPAAALAEALPAPLPAKLPTTAPSGLPADPLAEIAARLKGGSVTPHDLTYLRALTAAGDERATELLAWCHLRGVGMPRDPVPAYLLYGIAAGLGVPNARRNQAIVYETAMTPDERQAALTIENRVMLEPGRN